MPVNCGKADMQISRYSSSSAVSTEVTSGHCPVWYPLPMEHSPGSAFTVKAWILPHLRRIANARGQTVTDVVHQALVRTIIESDEDRLRAMLEETEDPDAARESAMTSASSDPFVSAVVAHVRRRGGWAGSLAELLGELPAHDGAANWPPDPTRAAHRLRQAGAQLAAASITMTIDRARDRSRRRIFTFTAAPNG